MLILFLFPLNLGRNNAWTPEMYYGEGRTIGIFFFLISMINSIFLIPLIFCVYVFFRFAKVCSCPQRPYLSFSRSI